MEYGGCSCATNRFMISWRHSIKKRHLCHRAIAAETLQDSGQAAKSINDQTWQPDPARRPHGYVMTRRHPAICARGEEQGPCGTMDCTKRFGGHGTMRD